LDVDQNGPVGCRILMPDRGFCRHAGCRSGFEPTLAELRKEFQHT
jgi:hypothetical protein